MSLTLEDNTPNVQNTSSNLICYESIRSKLFEWWMISKREFPWRYSHSPYEIMVAEILLHRTRAAQVIPLYDMFLDRFPTFESLITTNAKELKSIFHSAGLNWRWDKFMKMVNEINKRFNGVIPSDSDKLTSLPGVSQYIASAIRCFGYGYPEVIMDTNTVRITGRLHGLIITDSSRRNKKFRGLLELMIDTNRPEEFNFAMIDLAAKICKARNPECTVCPINQNCKYFEQKRLTNGG